VVKDEPLTLEQALNRVNATTAQKAVIDDFLGRTEAQIVTLLLALEGWRSYILRGEIDQNQQRLLIDAIYVAGDNTLQGFMAQRQSIAACRLMAEAPQQKQ
jgi:hypothetical protein